MAVNIMIASSLWETCCGTHICEHDLKKMFEWGYIQLYVSMYYYE